MHSAEYSRLMECKVNDAAAALRRALRHDETESASKLIYDADGLSYTIFSDHFMPLRF